MTARFEIHFKQLLPRAAACVLLAAPLGLQAQSIDAERYVNAQGVEVIQGRRAAPAAAPAPAPAPAPEADNATVPSTPARPAVRTEPAAQARPAAFQIGAGEQDVRDRDRLAILKQEMQAENSALEQKIRILSNKELRSKLDPEQLKRLQETTLEHERNIRALTAEINRARKSM